MNGQQFAGKIRIGGVVAVFLQGKNPPTHQVIKRREREDVREGDARPGTEPDGVDRAGDHQAEAQGFPLSAPGGVEQKASGQRGKSPQRQQPLLEFHSRNKAREAMGTGVAWTH